MQYLIIFYNYFNFSAAKATFSDANIMRRRKGYYSWLLIAIFCLTVFTGEKGYASANKEEPKKVRHTGLSSLKSATSVGEVKIQVQRTSIDSLRQIAENPSLKGEIAINALYTLGGIFMFYSADSSGYYYQRGLEIAEKTKNLRLLMAGCVRFAYTLDNQGKFDEALEYLNKAQKLSTEANNDTIQMEVLYFTGNIHKRQENFTLAREYYEQALAGSKQLGIGEFESISHAVIAETLIAEGQYLPAAFYLDSAFLATEATVPRWQEKRFSPRYIRTFTTELLGAIYTSQGQFENALKTLRTSLSITEDKALLPQIYSQMALCFAHLKMVDSATYYAGAALHAGEEVNNRYQLQLCYIDIAKMYEVLENFREAYHYQQLYTESRAQSYRQRVIEKVAYFRKVQEREQFDQEQQRRRITELLLGAALGLTILVAGFFFYQYREKRHTTLTLESVNTALQAANEEVQRQVSFQTRQSQELEYVNAALHEQNEILERLNAEQNELMSIVAHDLRNPLAAIIGMVEVLSSNQDVLQNKGTLYVERIGISSEQMMSILKPLSEINRLESGAINVNLEACDVRHILSRLVSIHEVVAARKAITISMQLNLELDADTKSDTPVITDVYMLNQVLDNLLSNAIKYSPFSTTIFLTATSKNHGLRVEIRDEGPGISEEDQPKLFGKFARLSAKPTGGEHSTGLGLSIVKKMVEAMNGKVWCESELGKGATFIVELPQTTE